MKLFSASFLFTSDSLVISLNEAMSTLVDRSEGKAPTSLIWTGSIKMWYKNWEGKTSSCDCKFEKLDKHPYVPAYLKRDLFESRQLFLRLMQLWWKISWSPLQKLTKCCLLTFEPSGGNSAEMLNLDRWLETAIKVIRIVRNDEPPG